MIKCTCGSTTWKETTIVNLFTTDVHGPVPGPNSWTKYECDECGAEAPKQET